MSVRKWSTVGFSALILAAGIVLLVETALLGGGIGYFFGAVLVVAGAGRLYVSLR